MKRRERARNKGGAFYSSWKCGPLAATGPGLDCLLLAGRAARLTLLPQLLVDKEVN